MFDYIIIGSGITGVTVANLIAARLNKKVLLIEKRNHIGGNCYDYLDEDGILIHKYGPHIFHTNYKDVFDYLSNLQNGSFINTKYWHQLTGRKSHCLLILTA